MLRLLTTVSCLVAATAAVAEPSRLSTEDLKKAFTGALVEMDTPAGTVIPVRFTNDGLVSGKAGVLASVLGAARDRGRWWAANDRLCVKWFRWFEARTRCASIRQEGKRIYWSGEGGRSGTGTIAEPAPVIAALAPTPPEPALRPAIELAETAPEAAPAEPEAKPAGELKVPETAMKTENEGTPGGAPSIRFATAALATMSLMPPLVTEPSHLLDGSVRSASDAEPKLGMAKSEHPSPPEAAARPQLPTTPEARTYAAKPQAHPKAPTHASSTMIRVSYRVAGVDEDDILNVRSGPALYYESVGGLPPEGRGVKIVGPCRDDWCPIQHGSMTGWVNRYFLTEEPPAPTAAAFAR